MSAILTVGNLKWRHQLSRLLAAGGERVAFRKSRLRRGLQEVSPARCNRDANYQCGSPARIFASFAFSSSDNASL